MPFLTRWLDQPTRILLRQVLRRPLRAGLTSLGAATSVAVLVTALQWIDAINLLVDDFFRQQQRQDVTLGLVDAVRTTVVAGTCAPARRARRRTASHGPGGFSHEQRSRREVVVGVPPTVDWNAA